MAAIAIPEFSLGFSCSRDRAVVTVRGELDHHSAPQLRAGLTDLIEIQGIPSLVIDVSAMTFIDSTGLAVLVGALRRMRERNGQLWLSGVSSPTRRVLEVSGLHRVFEVAQSAGQGGLERASDPADRRGAPHA